jgi:hypothetical protein
MSKTAREVIARSMLHYVMETMDEHTDWINAASDADYILRELDAAGFIIVPKRSLEAEAEEVRQRCEEIRQSVEETRQEIRRGARGPHRGAFKP